jgi:hypothetical protein
VFPLPRIVGVGVWLINAMVDARHADECMAQGLRSLQHDRNAATLILLREWPVSGIDG